MRLKTLLAGLVLSSVGLGSGVSHAALTQMTLRTAGNACVPVDNASNEAHQSSWFVNEWGISNGSTTTAQLVVCPLTTYYPGGLNVVNVHTWDRNGSQAVSCSLLRINSNGKVVIDTKQTTNAQNQSAWIPLALGTAGANNATLTLLCSIPPQTASGVSGIASYEAVYFSQP